MSVGLCDELDSIYRRFGSSYDENGAQETFSQLQSLLTRLAREISSGTLPPDAVSACVVDKVRQINIVSHQLSCLESESVEIEAAAKLEVSELLHGLIGKVGTTPLNQDEDFSEDSTSQEEDRSILRYRAFFPEHISWPYPSPSEGEQLLAAVPAHNRAQLSNWFVNSRRRSEWSALPRNFGVGTKEGMEELIRRVESGHGSEEESESVDKVRKYFEDDGSLTIRPDLKEMVEKIEREMKRQCPSRKRKLSNRTEVWVDTPKRKRSSSGSRLASEGSSPSERSSSSEGSRSTLASSPTFHSSSTLNPFEDLKMKFYQPQPLPRGLQAHHSCVDSPAASEYPNAGVPASRRCVSDSRSHTSPNRSTPPYRSVSSSFALGMESTLAGSLMMPIDPDFLTTCPTAGSAWNGGESLKTSDYRFASTSSSTLGADHSDERSLNTTTTSNTWYETLQDDRWTDLYPWLGRTGSDSLSGLDMFGQDEEVNWLMGTELVGLC